VLKERCRVPGNRQVRKRGVPVPQCPSARFPAPIESKVESGSSSGKGLDQRSSRSSRGTRGKVSSPAGSAVRSAPARDPDGESKRFTPSFQTNASAARRRAMDPMGRSMCKEERALKSRESAQPERSTGAYR